MKKIILLCLYGTRLVALIDECDITDYLLRPVIHETVAILSLLDLAEQNNIVDHTLFYDELCQASLRLYSQVQQFYDQHRTIAEGKVEDCMALCTLLQGMCSKLSVQNTMEEKYHYAIDTILYYTHHFLKYNIRVNTDIKAAELSC